MVGIITLERQKLSQSNPVLIRPKLASVLIRAHLCGSCIGFAATVAERRHNVRSAVLIRPLVVSVGLPGRFNDCFEESGCCSSSSSWPCLICCCSSCGAACRRSVGWRSRCGDWCSEVSWPGTQSEVRRSFRHKKEVRHKTITAAFFQVACTTLMTSIAFSRPTTWYRPKKFTKYNFGAH